MTSCLAVHQVSSEKGVYSIRKEFALKGSKFFPFREQTPFQKGGKSFHRVVCLENISVHLRVLVYVVNL